MSLSEGFKEAHLVQLIQETLQGRKYQAISNWNYLTLFIYSYAGPKVTTYQSRVPLWFFYLSGKCVQVHLMNLQVRPENTDTHTLLIALSLSLSLKCICWVYTHWRPFFSASYTSSSRSGWGTFGGGLALIDIVNNLLALLGFLLRPGVLNTTRFLQHHKHQVIIRSPDLKLWDRHNIPQDQTWALYSSRLIYKHWWSIKLMTETLACHRPSIYHIKETLVLMTSYYT